MSFEKGFEFDYFARRPVYEKCPTWLIERCNVGPQSQVADLGCGSGILTRLLLDRFKDAPDFRVFAIDPSPWELAIARSSIQDSRATFIEGRAQQARQLVPRDIDAIFLCNVLHQIPLQERAAVLQDSFSLVRPGGRIGMNTLFYDGAIGPGERVFYLRVMAEVRQALQRDSIPWQDVAHRPVALQQLTPDQHRELLERAGFDQVEVEELQFDWSLEDWQALSRYSVFVQGALWPTIDVASGSNALAAGFEAAYRALGVSTVRRGWLHCCARRPPE